MSTIRTMAKIISINICLKLSRFSAPGGNALTVLKFKLNILTLHFLFFSDNYKIKQFIHLEEIGQV